MKASLYMVKDNKGYTLVELIVVITILGLITIPVLNTLLTGNWLQNKTFGQVELQEMGQDVLNQIIEGKGSVGGLRSAQEVVYTNDALAFITVNAFTQPRTYTNVTYQLRDAKLYYTEKVLASEEPPAVFSDWTLAPVLENVTVFSIAYGDYNDKSYKLLVDLAKPTKGVGINKFTMATEIKPRKF